eukprot:CAMPEP_0182542504 /NCGR_PEP_ID=MMETSP1323-20130603/30258_1 /TAXON_ID=236787 /ORGANISM="Florenciella parvula, Strain RCC1693" /LENGTH=35 /DNA_ID= /DNA_START= /DNA_END= /DNA_ORIENTATION=
MTTPGNAGGMEELTRVTGLLKKGLHLHLMVDEAIA